MAHSSRIRLVRAVFTHSGVAALVLGVGLAWLLLVVPLSAQDILRRVRLQADESQGIKVYCDSIATWREDNQLVFLLRGNVWIEQGLTNLKASEVVLWIDQEKQRQTGISILQIYAEGEVKLEDRSGTARVPRALLELGTRVDPKFTPAVKYIRQEDRSAEFIVQRARAARTPAVAAPQPTAPRPPLAGAAAPPAPLPPVTVQGGPLPAPTPWTRAEKSVLQLTAAQPEPVAPVQPPGSLPPPPPPPPADLPPVVPQPIPGVPPGPLPRPNEVAPPPRPLGTEQAPTPRVMPGTPGIPGMPAGPGARPFTIRPRSTFQEIQARDFVLPSGETAVVLSNGVILTIFNADGKGGILDIEADRAVAWKKGTPQQIMQNLRSPTPQPDNSLEFYLSGNVEVRTKTKEESRLLRADEVYYDAGRHVAVALNGTLAISDPRLLHPLHLHADEILQLNENLWETVHTDINASILPWDPGLSLSVKDSTLESKKVMKRTIFGMPFINRATGQPVENTQRYFRGKNVLVRLGGFPVFWLPYIQGDAEDPLGPLENISYNYNQIFGFQLFTSWNVYDLLGMDAIPGTSWRLNLDYLSMRGPAAGTTFRFKEKDLFDIPGNYTGLVRAYGISDSGTDIIGGGRGTQVRLPDGMLTPVTHPTLRGRFLARINAQDLPEGFTVQSQISALSDRNFLEQYYQNEFFNDLNQETFLYVKQQQDFWAWNALVEPRIRNWVTETEWLPKADGYLLGLSLFDVVTSNTMASAGFGRLLTTDVPPFAYLPTDKNTDAGRFDLWQEFSVPFTAGAFQVVPYVIGDATYYTNTLDGDDRGRLLGAAGVRGSMPLSRLYPEVQSELFNVDGIYHKMVFSGNFYTAHSNTSYTQLPQFDRLHDDVSDLTTRDLQVNQQFYNAAAAPFLTMSPLYDYQVMALRKLVDNRIDTRDDMEVLQLGVRQRWQTKRGFPDAQHVIDWMVLDVSASIFPRADRDNFGNAVAFLEYDWLWNIGDRTSLTSYGWMDPIENGPRVFNVGANINRPDGTNFYLGYRQIDPLRSRAVIASVSYAFSRKYALTASTSYDFGVNQQVTSLVVSRTGTDFKVSFGINHNSILNNVGFVFEIVPNLVASRTGGPGAGRFYGSSLGGGR